MLHLDVSLARGSPLSTHRMKGGRDDLLPCSDRAVLAHHLGEQCVDSRAVEPDVSARKPSAFGPDGAQGQDAAGGGQTARGQWHWSRLAGPCGLLRVRWCF
ncbi:hypothetical protein ADK61_00330 [Streptomyces sp. XY66]|nr:hypothetical protein ADK96_34360 [Streptomyces sp. IGB124]KOU89237.1 hypothetical protein ADK61_00330 [Streptomyces sp. XY66]